MKKVESVFQKIKYTDSIAEVQENSTIQELLEYYANSADRSKMYERNKEEEAAHACYLNLALIYYYLDMPQEASEYAASITESEYRMQDGANFQFAIESLQKRLELNQVSSRHFPIIAPK